ncbi:hypothetical protein REPUB_Repub17cG0035800 [Reevesia pubescens]
MLCPEDVALVRQLPLGGISRNDLLVWRLSESGCFTVRSTYHEVRTMLGLEVTGSTQRQPIWKMIWTANVLPRVRIFLWKLLTDILPTGENLAKKCLRTDHSCCICGADDESWVHTFVTYLVSQKPTAVPTILDDPSSLIWKPPHRGTIKLNIDASFDTSRNGAIIEIVARDDIGGILFSACSQELSVLSAFMGEVYVILTGLKMAMSHRMHQIILENTVNWLSRRFVLMRSVTGNVDVDV